MDKLRPILTHKFWCLFVVVLAISIVGWNSGVGSLSEGTDKKRKELDASCQKVAKLQAAGAPNQKSMKGGFKIHIEVVPDKSGTVSDEF